MVIDDKVDTEVALPSVPGKNAPNMMGPCRGQEATDGKPTYPKLLSLPRGALPYKPLRLAMAMVVAVDCGVDVRKVNGVFVQDARSHSSPKNGKDC